MDVSNTCACERRANHIDQLELHSTHADMTCHDHAVTEWPRYVKQDAAIMWLLAQMIQS